MVAMDAYGPFDSGAGANITEATWRRFMRRMRGDLASARSGVIRDASNTLQVYDDNSGMQVKVRTGEVWIEGHWGEIHTEKTVPLAAADATFARKDRIVAACNFTNNTIEVYPLTGTPAASPSVPGLTQDGTKWEVGLGIVDVPALDTSISGQTTDARHYLDLPHAAKISTADLTANNTTAYVDSALAIPASAGRTYAIEGLLVITSTTVADAKVRLTGPTGATARLAGTRVVLGVAGSQGDIDVAAAAISSEYGIGAAGIGTAIGVPISGRLSTADAAGTLTLQWAQYTAEVSNTTLVQGSWMKITPLS